jgi:dihydrofolate reductase
MSEPSLKAIVAMASNRIIGRDGDLPWRLSEDLKWFKKLTLGHPIVMGRKTMESIGRPLPKRRNIVISRSLEEAPEGFELIASCDEVRELCGEAETIFVIGGAQIYGEMLPECDEVLLSYVYHPYEGDTELPSFEEDFEMKEILYQDDDFELRRYVAKG